MLAICHLGQCQARICSSLEAGCSHSKPSPPYTQETPSKLPGSQPSTTLSPPLPTSTSLSSQEDSYGQEEEEAEEEEEEDKEKEEVSCDKRQIKNTEL